MQLPNQETVRAVDELLQTLKHPVQETIIQRIYRVLDVSGGRDAADGGEALADYFLEIVSNPDHPDLTSQPEGSLGKAFSKLMHALPPNASIMGFNSADSTAWTPVRRFVHYTHDLRHLLNGFSTDMASEMGNIAFTFGQAKSEIGYPVVFSWHILLTTLWEPQNLEVTMDAISLGWQMGRKARNFAQADWKMLWALPVDEVRALLGISLADVAEARRMGGLSPVNGTAGEPTLPDYPLAGSDGKSLAEPPSLSP